MSSPSKKLSKSSLKKKSDSKKISPAIIKRTSLSARSTSPLLSSLDKNTKAKSKPKLKREKVKSISELVTSNFQNKTNSLIESELLLLSTDRNKVLENGELLNTNTNTTLLLKKTISPNKSLPTKIEVQSAAPRAKKDTRASEVSDSCGAQRNIRTDNCSSTFFSQNEKSCNNNNNNINNNNNNNDPDRVSNSDLAKGQTARLLVAFCASNQNPDQLEFFPSYINPQKTSESNSEFFNELSNAKQSTLSRQAHFKSTSHEASQFASQKNVLSCTIQPINENYPNTNIRRESNIDQCGNLTLSSKITHKSKKASWQSHDVRAKLRSPDCCHWCNRNLLLEKNIIIGIDNELFDTNSTTKNSQHTTARLPSPIFAGNNLENIFVENTGEIKAELQNEVGDVGSAHTSWRSYDPFNKIEGEALDEAETRASPLISNNIIFCDIHCQFFCSLRN
jgi:hypothetical protein